MKSSEINDSATISCSFSIRRSRRSASLAWRCARCFLESTFPDTLESHNSNAWTREHSPRSSADEARRGVLLCCSPKKGRLRKGWKTTFAGAGWLHLSDPYSESGAVVVAAQLPLRDGQWGNTYITVKVHYGSYGGFEDVLRWFNHRKMRSQQSRIGGVIMGPNNNQYCTSLRPDMTMMWAILTLCLLPSPQVFRESASKYAVYIIWDHDEVLLKQVKPWKFSEALGSLMASVCPQVYSLHQFWGGTTILGERRTHHGMVGMKWPLLSWSVIIFRPQMASKKTWTWADCCAIHFRSQKQRILWGST